jgi:OOP family OmpA-OmpF porin
VLQTLEGKKIQITGHTDAVGAQLSNVALSRGRAQAVKNYLVANRLTANNLLTAGLGSEQPLVSNDTPEGRAKNRRIEFKVLP